MGKRRRFPRDVNGACRAVNWMLGEENRPGGSALPHLWTSRTRTNVFVWTCSQRVILAALRWVDADSAVDENGALAKLQQGRTGYAPGVSSNVGSFEYSRVSLPDSVVEAPPLIEMLPAEAKFFLEEFQSRMLLTAGGRRCDSGSQRGTWMPQ